MSDDLVDCVVMDNGSGFTKVGYSGEDSPRSIFTTLVGTKMTTVEDESSEFPESSASAASPTASSESRGYEPGHDYIIGDEVQKLRDTEHKYAERAKIAKEKGEPIAPLSERLLSVARPVQFGEIKTWDEIEEIWAHSFANELKIDSASFPVSLCIHFILYFIVFRFEPVNTYTLKMFTNTGIVAFVALFRFYLRTSL